MENLTDKNRVRVYATGACEGLPELLSALAGHPEIELVGSNERVHDAAPTLTGGHLQAVMHATRGSSLPTDDLAAIREHTAAPVILLVGRGLVAAARRGARGRPGRRRPAAAAARERRLRDQEGGARRPPRRRVAPGARAAS